MNPNECVRRFGISFTYMIESIDSKLISVCLINDYLLIADLHIFVYRRAECNNNITNFNIEYLLLLMLYTVIYNYFSSLA